MKPSLRVNEYQELVQAVIDEGTCQYTATTRSIGGVMYSPLKLYQLMNADTSRDDNTQFLLKARPINKLSKESYQELVDMFGDSVAFRVAMFLNDLTMVFREDDTSIRKTPYQRLTELGRERLNDPNYRYRRHTDTDFDMLQYFTPNIPVSTALFQMGEIHRHYNQSSTPISHSALLTPYVVQAMDVTYRALKERRLKPMTYGDLGVRMYRSALRTDELLKRVKKVLRYTWILSSAKVATIVEDRLPKTFLYLLMTRPAKELDMITNDLFQLTQPTQQHCENLYGEYVNSIFIGDYEIEPVITPNAFRRLRAAIQAKHICRQSDVICDANLAAFYRKGELLAYITVIPNGTDVINLPHNQFGGRVSDNKGVIGYLYRKVKSRILEITDFREKHKSRFHIPEDKLIKRLELWINNHTPSQGELE